MTKKIQRDRRWVIVQEKAFTHWANETVKKRNLEVTNVSKDFNTGIILINFFELLSGKILRENYCHVPKLRIQCINNIHIALTFMEREIPVRNPGCSAEDIVDAEKFGNKMVLGLLYTLYRYYRMNPTELVGDDAKGKKMREEDALLQWVAQTTKDYQGVNITNFKNSFNDGKAFLALCHAYSKLSGKDDFNYDEESNKVVDDVLEYAFNYAQEKMGIEKLLEVEEVRDGDIDDRALAIYVSMFHHAFKTQKELSEMKDQLGSASSQLQFQMKSKNDLVKMNLEMTKQLEEMNTKKEEIMEELNKIDSQIKDLKEANALKEKQLQEYDATQQKYKVEIQENTTKTEELNKQNDELEGKLKDLEASHANDDMNKQKLKEELQALKEELEKLNRGIEQAK